MKQTVLIIDAGHGGVDPSGKYTTFPSKCSKHEGQWHFEGVTNRQFAAQFIEEASKLGFLCIPVHHPYKDFSLQSRTDLANYYAKVYESTVFLSFHSNASTNNSNGTGTARGFVGYTLSNNGTAFNLLTKIEPQITNVFNKLGSLRANHIWQAGFHVLRYTSMPAILFELGFHDNYPDSMIIRNHESRQMIVQAIASELNKALI
jgi:N-acetylmuramoyl-L-alanine amidase